MTTGDSNPGAGSAGALGVLVLGMHRGGTSAVAGRFADAGFVVGDDGDGDRLAPDDDNPLGYHELHGTVALNDAILDRLGGNWFHPPAGPDGDDDRRAALVPRVRARVDALLAAAAPRPLIVKDPRIALLLDVWEPAVAGRLHPVLVIRHPLEVAASLAVRNRLAPAGALAAWELSMTRLLAGLAGREVSVAPYARLLESPDDATRMVRQVIERLPPERAAGVSADVTGDSPLRAELRRRRAGGADALGARHRDLWRRLEALKPGLQRLPPPPGTRIAGGDARALTALERRRMRARAAFARELSVAREPSGARTTAPLRAP